MKQGKNYLIKLAQAPSITPTEGGWATVRYEDGRAPACAVSPIVNSQTAWARSVHVFALANGPDPVPGEDSLVYRDTTGAGESRVIESITALD